MLDLNNYVATSVSWTQLYYVKPGLKPAKNARKIYFPNGTWAPFFESPETLEAFFGGHNSVCISRTEKI